MKKNIKEWCIAAADRAVRTIAQAAIAAIGSTTVMGEVDWRVVGSTAVLAGLLSVLTSIATGLPEVRVEKEEGQNNG